MTRVSERVRVFLLEGWNKRTRKVLLPSLLGVLLLPVLEHPVGRKGAVLAFSGSLLLLVWTLVQAILDLFFAPLHAKAQRFPFLSCDCGRREESEGTVYRPLPPSLALPALRLRPRGHPSV